jgi:hypothetical protein
MGGDEHRCVDVEPGGLGGLVEVEEIGAELAGEGGEACGRGASAAGLGAIQAGGRSSQRRATPSGGSICAGRGPMPTSTTSAPSARRAAARSEA